MTSLNQPQSWQSFSQSIPFICTDLPTYEKEIHMKTTVSIIASLVLSTSSMADTTVTSKSKAVTFTVHSAGINYGLNSEGALQVEAYTSVRLSNPDEMVRSYSVVTGCDKEGGYIGKLKDGKVVGEQHVWIRNGDSMLDAMAESMCEEAIKHATKQASTDAKPSKTGI
jgi:hypothetical protein